MEMNGHRRLAVTQQQAWDALNDPEILKACIPGCERIEAAGEGSYSLTMAVRIGPVAARFNGRISLSDVNPPESYTLAFDGQGGAAGFGKGVARVKLAPAADAACDLEYSATAQVGGKIAQVGQRLVDGVARSMAEEFFRRLDENMPRQQRVTATTANAATVEAEAGSNAEILSPTPDVNDPMSTDDDDKSSPAVDRWIWIVLGLSILAVVALYLAQ